MSLCVINVVLSVQIYMGAWAWNAKTMTQRRTLVGPPLGESCILEVPLCTRAPCRTSSGSGREKEWRLAYDRATGRSTRNGQ